MDFQRQMCKQLKDTQAAMENVAVPEPTLAKPTLFHGYENENVDRWLRRFSLYLTNRKIRTDSSQAAIQLALHLSGPAESFYYNLSSPVRSTFEDLQKALKERFSPAHRSLRFRQALSIRRQEPSESIEKFLADLNEKFSRLDLRDGDKLSYLIQGLRPDIQAEVLKKEPKTYTEAEDTARLIYSIQQSLLQRRKEEISRMVLKGQLSSPQTSTNSKPASTEDKKILAAVKDEGAVLAKLEALIDGVNNHTEQQERSLLSKFDALLEKATRQIDDSSPRDVKTASLAAYSEPKRETLDCMREIRRIDSKLEELCREMDARMDALIVADPYVNSRDGKTARIAAFSETNRSETPEFTEGIRRMERSFTNKLESMYRRVDNQINSLSHRNRISRPELSESRERNRQPKQVCYKCGRVGYIRYNFTIITQMTKIKK